MIVQHKARADKCELRLADSMGQIGAVEVELHACQAALAAVPPPKPPPSPVWPLVGLASGVVGSLLLTGSIVADVPSMVRFPMLLVGVGGIAGGMVMVWP